MSMKGIGVLLASLSLMACSSMAPLNVNHAPMNEVTKTESAFTEANVSSALAAATPPLSVSQAETRWRFTAEEGLSFIGDPPLNLTIEPTSDDSVSVEVLNDVEASVKGARFGNVLSLRVSAQNGSKVILYLPKKTAYLMLKTFNTLNAHLSGHVLYLNLDGCDNVDFSSASWMLEYLRIQHSSHVTLASINTPYLVAWINDSNTLKIHGTINLRELNVQNSRSVEWYWLNSPILTLNVQDSSVLLAGDVVYANMKVNGYGVLDAKYLTTTRLFVHTFDQAVADVRATDALNALAAGHSNIYYYTQPAVLSRYYREQGSILYQGEKPPVCDLPYCSAPLRVLPG